MLLMCDFTYYFSFNASYKGHFPVCEISYYLSPRLQVSLASLFSSNSTLPVSSPNSVSPIIPLLYPVSSTPSSSTPAYVSLLNLAIALLSCSPILTFNMWILHYRILTGTLPIMLELASLQKKDTCTLVPLPPKLVVIGCNLKVLKSIYYASSIMSSMASNKHLVLNLRELQAALVQLRLFIVIDT